MKKSVLNLILSLIALPAGLMLGLQIGTVRKQYDRARENFTVDIKKAVSEVQAIYARWNSHTSNQEDAASYNSLYVNEDSTFSVLIAQTAQPYPLLDFEPDTVLPEIRKAQFLRFQEELERTRRRENTRLREFYVLRSIQFCADCETAQLSIAQIFPLDSLVRDRLAANGVRTETQLGFYQPKKQRYGYLSPGADTTAMAAGNYQFPISAEESLHLHFPEQGTALRSALRNTFISSAGLVFLALFSCGWAAHMLIRQKKLSEMKNDFINNVTHEFKTPIATIDFALANIENEQVLRNPDAIRQFTRVIREESKRLNRQVEKVLEAAVLDRQGLELKREAVDVHMLIDELQEAYRIKLGAAGQLTSGLEATQHVVHGDPFHLSNTISNLLDNALKYGEGERLIHIFTRNEDAALVIGVQDNGIGISREEQQRIFEKFYRVSTGNLHNTKGFGLGLSYVKAIVEAHHGRIVVTSQRRRGSTFEITIPLPA